MKKRKRKKKQKPKVLLLWKKSYFFLLFLSPILRLKIFKVLWVIREELKNYKENGFSGKGK